MTRSTSGLPKSSPPYKYCKAPENARALARAVYASLASEDTSEVAGEIIVPRGTFNQATEKDSNIFKDAIHRAIYGNVEPEPKNESVLLTTENDQNFIQHIIKIRDKNNNGMSQSEVISIIMTLTGASHIQARNQFNYLHQCKMFPELKNHGKTQHAQQTTTKRRNLIMEKLLH